MSSDPSGEEESRKMAVEVEEEVEEGREGKKEGREGKKGGWEGRGGKERWGVGEGERG